MLQRPTAGPVSSTFGWRRLAGEGPTYHGGVDFAGALGSPIRAVKDGVVTVSAPNGTFNRYGNLVVIKHDDPREAPYSLYAHLNTRRVRQGQRVKAGQIIGGMGNTSGDRCYPGRPTPCNPNHKVATHLHFELLRAFPAASDVGRIDPTAYLSPGLRQPAGSAPVHTSPLLYSSASPLLYPAYSGPMSGLSAAVDAQGQNVPFDPPDPSTQILIMIGLLPFAVTLLRSVGLLREGV